MSESQTCTLLRRWNEGDTNALGLLVESNLPWIRSLVRRRLGPALRARDETGDVVQEAMVRVLRGGPRFFVEDEDQFRGLVAVIVENVLRMRHRDSQRARRDVNREVPLREESVLDLTGTGPSRAAVRNEEAAWLELSMQLLSPVDREVIALRQFEGLSFVEVGARLQVPADTARIRFRRALARLAPLMKRLQDGDLGGVLRERNESCG